MPADEEGGVQVGTGHPIDAPLVRLEPAFLERQAEKAIGGTALRIHQRTGFVGEPSVVVVDRRAHHRFPRLGPSHLAVSPVRRQLPDEARMIGLADNQRFATRFATNGSRMIMRLVYPIPAPRCSRTRTSSGRSTWALSPCRTASSWVRCTPSSNPGPTAWNGSPPSTPNARAAVPP